MTGVSSRWAATEPRVLVSLEMHLFSSYQQRNKGLQQVNARFLESEHEWVLWDKFWWLWRGGVGSMKGRQGTPLICALAPPANSAREVRSSSSAQRVRSRGAYCSSLSINTFTIFSMA